MASQRDRSGAEAVISQSSAAGAFATIEKHAGNHIDAERAASATDGWQLFGVWKAIDPAFDWEEFADELDRIRSESKPTPPIDFDALDL
jgi:hypothetical protein